MQTLSCYFGLSASYQKPTYDLPSHAHCRRCRRGRGWLAECEVDLGDHGRGLQEVEQVHVGRNFAPDVSKVVVDMESTAR